MQRVFYPVSVHAARFNTENKDGVSFVEEQNSDLDPGVYQSCSFLVLHVLRNARNSV